MTIVAPKISGRSPAGRTQSNQPHQPRQVVWVQLEHLHPNPQQPRTNFDPETLEALATSLKSRGFEHPITAEQLPNGNYQIIDGGRRRLAAELAEIDPVPVLVEAYRGEGPEADRSRLYSAVVANEQSAALTTLERVRAYRKMLEMADKSRGKTAALAEVARAVGKSPTYIAAMIKILELPASIQERIERRELSSAPNLVAALLRLPPDLAETLIERMQGNTAAQIVTAAQHLHDSLAVPGAGAPNSSRGGVKKSPETQLRAGAQRRQAFRATPTPALFLAYEKIEEMPTGQLDVNALRGATERLCSECPSLPVGIEMPPSWMMLERAARAQCGSCEFSAPENRNLAICTDCPGWKVLAIAAGLMEARK